MVVFGLVLFHLCRVVRICVGEAFQSYVVISPRALLMQSQGNVIVWILHSDSVWTVASRAKIAAVVTIHFARNDYVKKIPEVLDS